MPSRHYIATGLVEWLLRRLGFCAVTTPWSSVYILWEWSARRDVYAHEAVHLEQIKRYGPVRFTVLYLFWLLRYGYQNNPMEIEAYAKAPIR